jgi:hypothetical protein
VELIPHTADACVSVRMFGFLHSLRRDAGLPTHVDVAIPDIGRSARDVATDLGLPLDMVEGIFLNHVPAGIDSLVRPGDRVAFIPFGTPASHPAFFGRFGAHPYRRA